MFVNISSGAQNTWQPPCQQIPDDVLVITARRAQLPEKPFFLLIIIIFFSLQMIHGRGGKCLSISGSTLNAIAAL